MRIFFDPGNELGEYIDIVMGSLLSPVRNEGVILVTAAMTGAEYETILADRKPLTGVTLQLGFTTFMNAPVRLLSTGDPTGIRLWERLRTAQELHHDLIIFHAARHDPAKALAFHGVITGDDSAGGFANNGFFVGPAPATTEIPLRVFQLGTVDSGVYGEVSRITRPDAQAIVSADDTADAFAITGNFVSSYQIGSVILVQNSVANDGEYTVTNASYDGGGNLTSIFVGAGAIPATDGGGTLRVISSIRSVLDATADFNPDALAGRVVWNMDREQASATITSIISDSYLLTTVISNSQKFAIGDRYIIRGGNFDWNKDGWPVVVTDPIAINDGVAWVGR